MSVLVGGLFISAASPPKPEFYGVYAVEENNLLGVDVSWSNYSPPKSQLAVMSGLWPAQRIVSTNAVRLGSAVNFLFFFESTGVATPMMIASKAILRPMSFKRNKTTWNGNVRPPQREKTEAQNFWSARDERIELLMKPVEGQPQMVLAVPPKALQDGVYQFNVGNAVLLFSVGSVEAAQQAQCLDEAATYVLAMWNSKLTPCEGSLPGSSAGSSGATTSGTVRTTNLEFREGREYFPSNAGSKWTYLVGSSNDGTPGKTLRQVVTLGPPIASHGHDYMTSNEHYEGGAQRNEKTSYFRIAQEGVYTIDGTLANSVEELGPRFPLAVGETWSRTIGGKPVSFSLDGLEDLVVLGRSYADCLRISYQVPGGAKGRVSIAPGVGTVRTDLETPNGQFRYLLESVIGLDSASAAVASPSGRPSDAGTAPSGSQQSAGTSGFAAPVHLADAVLSQGFAERSSAGLHTGIDLAPKGEPGAQLIAIAAAAGVVDKLQFNGAGCTSNAPNSGCQDHGLGNVVIIKHNSAGAEVFSLYAHLDSVNPALQVGTEVRRGEFIGVAGASGFGLKDYWRKSPASGALCGPNSGGAPCIHLHFELKTASTLANPKGRNQCGGEPCWGYVPSDPKGLGYLDPSDYGIKM